MSVDEARDSQLSLREEASLFSNLEDHCIFSQEYEKSRDKRVKLLELYVTLNATTVTLVKVNSL